MGQGDESYHIANRYTNGPATLAADPLCHGRIEAAETEGEGFEPSIEFNPYAGLANRCLQPLGHPSRKTGNLCWDLDLLKASTRVLCVLDECSATFILLP